MKNKIINFAALVATYFKPALPVACLLSMILLSGCGTESKAPKTSSGYETLTPGQKKTNPKAVELNEQGLEQLKAGDTAAAEKSFKAALDADISYGAAHNNLGSIYLDQGELYLAAWEFQYAAKLNPNDPRPHNNLALVYNEASKPEKAKQSLETAQKLNPNNQQIKNNLQKINQLLNPDTQNAPSQTSNQSKTNDNAPSQQSDK